MRKLEAKEISDTLKNVLDRLQIVDAALFVAHTLLEKPVSLIAKQTRLSESEVTRRIKYVSEVIRRHIEEER
ncbi:MAG: hypothetical protein D6698_01615 [Gammaproteobacteria bacterium]|nr:MAG: hypothetical protein D6698_01615 [Gammaproteobacteria bacterium]